MARGSYAQTSFLGGEWSKRAQGDFADPKYRTALNLCLNGFPIKEGAWTRRPGTAECGFTRAALPGRVLPFAFQENDPYTMEFTDGFLRFWSGASDNGIPSIVTTNDAVAVSSISTANPAVVTTSADQEWVTGNAVVFQGLGSAMPLLQNRVFTITVTDDTHFSIADQVTGATIDGSILGSLPSGVTVARVLEIATLWATGSWGSLRSIQAEERAILTNGTQPQVLQVTVDPMLQTPASFSLNAANFLDGPYLDPVKGGALVTPSGTTGSITLTLSFPAYSSTRSYNIGDFVSASSINYQSLVNQNLNNTPASSPTDWQVVSAGIAVGPNGFQPTDAGRLVRLFSQPAAWAVGTTYAAGNVVLYTDQLGGEVAYTSLVGSNTGNIPGTDTTNWAIAPLGQVWTWARITGFAELIAANPAGSSNIGSLTYNGGLTAAFNGNTAQNAATGAQSVKHDVNIGPANAASEYVGKNYGASPQSVALAAWWPSTDYGIVELYAGFQPKPDQQVQVSLYASNSSPTTPTNGTLLGQSDILPMPLNSAVTITSNDSSTQYQYVWMTVVFQLNGNSGGGLPAQTFINCSQIQFFSAAAAGDVVTVQIVGTFIGAEGETITQPLLYTTPISVWRLGLYNGTTGWPTCGTYIDDRVWLSGAIPNRIDASISGGFLTSGNASALVSNSINFAPTQLDGTVTDSNAIDYTFAGPDANPIFWMEPDQQGIICGTQAGEWLVFPPSSISGFSPTNIAARRVTKIGCANIEPARTEHTLVFVQKYFREIKEYFADIFSGKFSAPDLAEKARHLTQTNLQEIAYQQELTPIIWGRRGDGRLVGATYKRDTLMTSSGPTYIGWHQHTLGSGRSVTSLRVGPSGNGNLDTLTMVTKDAATGYYHVEAMTPLFEEGAALSSAWFVDSGIVPTTVLSSTQIVLNGLWPLNGSKISAWIAGYDFGDYIVSNGSITVPLPVSVKDDKGLVVTTVTYAMLNALSSIPTVAGFTYTSQGQQPRALMPQDAFTQAGPALGKTRRSQTAGLMLEGTQGLYAGTRFDRLNKVILSTVGDALLPVSQLKTGIARHTLTDEGGFDSMVCWQVTRPYPATVAALQPYLETSDE